MGKESSGGVPEQLVVGDHGEIDKDAGSVATVTDLEINEQLYLNFGFYSMGYCGIGCYFILGIMALGITSLDIMVLGIMTLGIMSCSHLSESLRLHLYTCASQLYSGF